MGGVAGAALGAVLPSAAGAFKESVAGGQMVTDDLLARIAPRAPVAGAGASAAASNVTPAAPTAPSAPRQFTTKQGFGEPALRAVRRAVGDTRQARTLLDELEAGGMGDEVLAMNVGGDRTVRAVRAAANTPDSDAGQLVNERLARQGGALGAQVPRDIGTATGFGTEFPEVTAKRMQDDLSSRVTARYEAFKARGDIGPLALDENSAREFVPYVEAVRRNPELAALPETDARVINEAFHLLQQDVRAAARGTDAVTANTRTTLRNNVINAIRKVDPDYADVTRQYALDEDVGKVVQDAFATGRELRSPGAAVVALEEAERVPGSAQALRAGDVARMQEAARGRASNPDLGEFAQFRDVARAMVGTVRDKEQFLALHGPEAYDRAMKLLLPKIRAAAQNAAARGNSTTAKQLLDALAFGDDAMLDALNSLASGSPTQGIVRNMMGRAVNPMQRAYRLGVGQTATDAADLLTTRGAGEVRTLLDLLDELGQSDAARRAAVQPIAGATSRTGVSRVP